MRHSVEKTRGTRTLSTLRSALFQLLQGHSIRNPQLTSLCTAVPICSLHMSSAPSRMVSRPSLPGDVRSAPLTVLQPQSSSSASLPRIPAATSSLSPVSFEYSLCS